MDKPARMAHVPADATAEFRIPRQWREAPEAQADHSVSGPNLRPAYAPVPIPPSDFEKKLYTHRDLSFLVITSAISFCCLVLSQVAFLRMTPWLWVLVPLTIFTIAYYLISVAVNIFTRPFSMKQHKRLVRAWRPAEYPSVDVFLPVCGEPPHVVRNTWDHVRSMATAYQGRVDVYVLDDSPTEALERMALAFGFAYQRRPNRGWFKKAGNMRYAFERTMSDYILVLDADFAPRTDMLDEMLPYFDADQTLGIVQSPQYFRVHRGQGWVERGAGAVQELFYRSVQVSRQHHGAAICVGSCAVYRRAALASIGGSTLIEHSEDVHTGFDLQVVGWNLRYIPVVLAAGLCPDNVESFFTQQYRWCAGSMSLLGSRKFWKQKMRVRARLSYVSGFCYYLHTGLLTLVGPLIPLLLVTVFPAKVALVNYLLIAPSVIYNFIVFPMWHRTSYRLEAWTAKLLYGWAHLFAIWDILRRRRMGWQPTGGTAKKSRTRRLWLGLRVWTLGTGVAWAGAAAARVLAGDDPLTFAPLFLAGMFYLTIAAQAVLIKPEADAEVVL